MFLCDVRAYKLLHLRKNGTLGPLFINRRQIIPLHQWLKAEDHPTRGYAHRPGWHVTLKPYAPHLSTVGRVWAMVNVRGTRTLLRPLSQGGKWLLADEMMVLKLL